MKYASEVKIKLSDLGESKEEMDESLDKLHHYIQQAICDELNRVFFLEGSGPGEAAPDA